MTVCDISESQEPQRKRDSSFYVALFCAVLPLWSVVPASWLFVVYSLYTGRIWHYGVSGIVIFSLALGEVSAGRFATDKPVLMCVIGLLQRSPLPSGIPCSSCTSYPL